MKRLILQLFLAFHILILNGQKSSEKVFVVKPATGRIIIDGRLSEWKNADSIIFYHHQDKQECIIVKALWDYDNLYFAFRVRDLNLNTHIHENGLEIWTDDCVEFYICTDSSSSREGVMTSKDFQFMANLKNQTAMAMGYADKPGKFKGIDSWMEKCKKHVFWNSEFKSGSVLYGSLNNNNDKDNSYTIEFAVKWSWIQVSPNTNDRFHSDFCIEDLGRDYSFRCCDWSQLSDNFAQPKRWKTIFLTGYPLNKPSFVSKHKAMTTALLSFILLFSGLLIGLKKIRM